jgi:hypothetical protein
MGVGYDHEMPIVVRIAVQDQKCVPAAQKDEVFAVGGVLRCIAENAFGRLGLC